MAKGKNQHVVPHADGWAVKSAGAERATKVTSTQQEAINVARQKNSYGNDSHPPEG